MVQKSHESKCIFHGSRKNRKPVSRGWKNIDSRITEKINPLSHFTQSKNAHSRVTKKSIGDPPSSVQLQNMAWQVKEGYGGKRFATFLLRNVTYETPLQTIQMSCSPFALPGQDSIRFGNKDEDRDIVNISPDDPFAFSEMVQKGEASRRLRLQKENSIEAHEVNSPVQQQN